MTHKLLSVVCLVLLVLSCHRHTVSADDNEQEVKSFEEENYGVRYADDCEGTFCFSYS